MYDRDQSDTALLRRWQNRRDADAFAELVHRHGAMVHATSARILANATEAEDVTQECFLKLAAMRSPRGSSLAGLLYTIATRLSFNLNAATQRRAEREHQFAVQCATPSDVAADSALCAEVDKAIVALPTYLRDPVVRHFLEGISYAQLAAEYSLDESTVRYRTKKGVEQIRKRLASKGEFSTTPAFVAYLEALSAPSTALPKSLIVTLGKQAIAGSSVGVAAPHSAFYLTGVALVMKKKIAALAFGALVIGTVTLYLVNGRSSPKPGESTASANASSGPANERAEHTHRYSNAAVRTASDDVSAVAASTIKQTTNSSPNVIPTGAERLGRLLLLLNKSNPFNPLSLPNSRKIHDNGHLFRSSDVPPSNGMHHLLYATELYFERVREFVIDHPELRSLDHYEWDETTLREYIAYLQGPFNAIRQGLEVGNVAMPSYVGPLGLEELPYLSEWRNLARFMAIEAAFWEAEGRHAEAFENYSEILEFANAFPSGSEFFSGLVGYATSGQTVSSLIQALSGTGAHPETLADLARRIVDIESRSYTLPDALRQHIAQNEAAIAADADSTASLRHWANVVISDSLTPEALVEVGAMTDDELAEAFQTYQDDLRRLAEVLADPFETVASLDPSTLHSQNPISAALIPPMLHEHTIEAWHHANLRAATIAAAAEAYRRVYHAYPAALGALKPEFIDAVPVDPFTGDEFVYRATVDDYTLYSRGANGLDDGGTHTSSVYAQQGDVVYRGLEN